MDYPDEDNIPLLHTDPDDDDYDDYKTPNTSRTDETSFKVPRSIYGKRNNINFTSETKIKTS